MDGPFKRPPRSMKLARVEKKIFNYARGLGLFDAGRLEDPRSMLTLIPERVDQFRAEITAATSRLAEVFGSHEAVAKMISTTVGTPVAARSIKTWLEPELLSQHPLATLNRITVTLALAVMEHLDNSGRSGRATFSQQDLDNGLIAVPRLFLRDNLEILKPRLQPEPVSQGFDLYQFLHLIFPSLIHGMTDTAAASMLSVSRSLITKIKNRKLSITRVTAKGLAENLEAAWPLMMDEVPPTLGDDWLEMPAEWELEFVEDAETTAAAARHGPELCLAAGRAGRSRMRREF
jgi:plasmid maintenance system antidote protein VapI